LNLPGLSDVLKAPIYHHGMTVKRPQNNGLFTWNIL